MSIYRPQYRDRATGKLKQSRVWWYGFTFAGRRIQESSKSTRKTIAAEAEKNRRRDLEQAYAGMPTEKPEQRIRTIRAALKDYRAGYELNHRKNSIRMVRQRSAPLLRFLGSLLLPDVDESRIIEYIEARIAEKAGGRTINMEIQILAAATGATWKMRWPKVKKLEENHDIGQALETAQEKAILDAARVNQSKLIYPFLYTLTWTGLRGAEARSLRWGQVNLGDNPDIRVEDSKTLRGRRSIPMSANLKAVLQQHAAWYAAKLGPLQPCWYVFPSSNRLAPKDPTKPVTSLRTAWGSVRTAAGVACRMHDLRHSFCTKLGEAGVSEGAMLDMMGHVSAAMLRRYSHIRAQARRDAIDAIESRQILDLAAKETAKVASSVSVKSVVTN